MKRILSRGKEESFITLSTPDDAKCVSPLFLFIQPHDLTLR